MKKAYTIIIIGLFFLGGCSRLRNEPAIELSTADLETDYNESSSQADEKYIGRTLKVTGNIAHYAQIRGVVGISLERSRTEGEWRVICLVDKDSQPDVYSKLKQGQSITFVGTGNREKESTLIMIKDCKVEQY